ncbi:hypothetical protein M433DRAFT_2463 [Acidomyces richmondensis BFW]|nr:MAG: hypothetical protein FE78DRAFT_28091 [Acidomyces sp. 'richmondensis']KYG47911.1 hypothetical protein M433DRAFT_2463 [Acidomyces richmondensis BFW]
MFRTTFTNRIITPIPADVNPDRIIDLLHDDVFNMKVSPVLDRFSVKSREGNRTTYDIWEGIDILPFGWWKQQIQFTATFEHKSDGVTIWVDAPAGVSHRAVSTVRRAEGDERQMGAADALEWAKSGKNAAIREAMVLEEIVDSSCPIFLKVFVGSTLVSVHKTIHERFIEKARQLCS